MGFRPMLSVWVTLAFCATVGVAAAVHATFGFGFALVLVPVAAAMLGPKSAIAVCTAVGIVTPAGMALTARDTIATGPAARILLAAVAGAPLGLVALTRLSSTTLQLLIALAVSASVAFLWFRPHARHGGAVVDVAGGFVSGALAASVGANGPPVVLALQARHLPPDPFRTTTSACFAAINTAVFVGFVVTGHVDWEVMPLALWSMPFLGAGWWAGTAVRVAIPTHRFRHLVLALLAASAVTSAVLAVV